MELHERLAKDPWGSGHDGYDQLAEIKNRIHFELVSELGPRLFDVLDSDEIRRTIATEIRLRLELEQGLAHDDRERLAAEIGDDIFGYGPLERVLSDSTVSEVMVNGSTDIWIERDGRLTQTELRFTDDSQLRRIITKMVGQIGRRIDESSPMVDARLPDGSRVNAVIPPLSLSGPLLTIRRFAKERFGLEELTRLGTVTPEVVGFLCGCVRADLNILVSGGTGSGKTTMLNALSAAVPDSNRIVTIEDAAELQLKQAHVLRLEGRPKNIEGQGEVTIRDLVRNALRMRPERIIVGEVRGAEAFDLLQAMNTGHDGSMGTLHANNPREALARLESMITMGGYSLPSRTIREMICASVDVIIQTARLRDGSRRITHVTEVMGMEGDVIITQDLFVYEILGEDAKGNVLGRHRSTGIGRPRFWDRARYFGEEHRLAAALDAAEVAGEPL